eukprot:3079892-Pyramimonas_sp.AAC.1
MPGLFYADKVGDYATYYSQFGVVVRSQGEDGGVARYAWPKTAPARGAPGAGTETQHCLSGKKVVVII